MMLPSPIFKCQCLRECSSRRRMCRVCVCVCLRASTRSHFVQILVLRLQQQRMEHIPQHAAHTSSTVTHTHTHISRARIWQHVRAFVRTKTLHFDGERPYIARRRQRRQRQTIRHDTTLDNTMSTETGGSIELCPHAPSRSHGFCLHTCRLHLLPQQQQRRQRQHGQTAAHRYFRLCHENTA